MWMKNKHGEDGKLEMQVFMLTFIFEELDWFGTSLGRERFDRLSMF